jgi:hypothetical protein
MIEIDPEFLEWLTKQFTELRKAQTATASVVRSTVSAFRDIDRERQSEDGQLTKVQQALVELIAHVKPYRLAEVSADELAAQVPNEIICLARQIQYADKTGTPLPQLLQGRRPPSLPAPTTPGASVPVPIETANGTAIVPMHMHRRSTDEPSVTFERDKEGDMQLRGSVKIKTLFGWMKTWAGWITAGVVAIYEAVQAIRKVLGH